MKHAWKRLVSVMLAVAMVFGLAVPAFAANNEAPVGSQGITWEKVDNDSVSFRLPRQEMEQLRDEPQYADNEMVRVSIILAKPSALEKGFSTEGIGQNASAMNYRASLINDQASVTSLISRQALSGAKLDVVWNMTLVANMISANVPYGSIEEIKNVRGVQDVVIETRYEPAVVSRDELDPNMSNAGQMTGGIYAHAAGYTGAGSKVAIIDTGLDIEHELFDAAAFEYAIEEDNAAREEAGKDPVALMTENDVAAVWGNLHASSFIDSADGVYRSAKIPFAVNYVDKDLDVVHVNDSQGEHGSHVAGIATGNRYVMRNGQAVSSLDEVLTQGEAPDAQVMVMKVFGKGGGAYDSDYMVAIEDAVIMGADAINLSLGSGAAGQSIQTNETYSAILDSLTQCGTVVTISAGNNGTWADQTPYGYIYSTDSKLHTGGSPGTFANAFTVASVDNDGTTGNYIEVNGEKILYTESTGYGNEPLVAIAGEHEFVYVDGPGVDENENVGVEGHDDFLALGSSVISGKVAVCNRGSSSFFAKVNAAAAQGAIAVIIVNNQPGTIGMNLTGVETTIPAVSITQADGQLLKTNLVDGQTPYYTGTLTVGEKAASMYYDSDSYTMSSFSSWGVPGNLTMKPEITAPGGNIYSVAGLYDAGGGHDQYENMSGTSMAAPQMAGLAAVFAQYIRDEGIADKVEISARQLAQSLLMSTAKPLIEEASGNYYSILNQGAGLVDMQSAIGSRSYILIDEVAVPHYAPSTSAASYADGKVKVELGDDPEREGEYTVKFTVYNLSDEELLVDLSGDFFTQDIFPFTEETSLMNTWTAMLGDVNITWTVNGEEFEPAEEPELDFNGDGKFTTSDVQALLDYVVGNRAEEEMYNLDKADLDEDEDIDTYDCWLALGLLNGAATEIPANDKIEVVAEIKLSIPEELDQNGNYVEGFLFVKEATDDEGAVGVEHSIPVLGYWGDWTEPSMFDVGSFLKYSYDLEDRVPYMYAALGDTAFQIQGFMDGDGYAVGGNPFGPAYDEDTYMPERNALNLKDTGLGGVRFTQIRNASGYRFWITDEEGSVIDGLDANGVERSYAAYYHPNSGKWQNTYTTVRNPLDLSGLEENSAVVLNFSLAPEYSVVDGAIDWDAVKAGTTVSLPVTVDNTAPVISVVDAADDPAQGNGALDTLICTVEDNQFIACVALFDEEGNLLQEEGADLAAEVGESREVSFSLLMESEDGDDDTAPARVPDHLYIQAYDYAYNYSTYKINLNTEELEETPVEVEVQPEFIQIIGTNSVKAEAVVTPWGVDETVRWSIQSVAYNEETEEYEPINEVVATVDENGVITGVSEGYAIVTATYAGNGYVEDPDNMPSGSALVQVKLVDKELNGVVWDENGDVWVSEFNLKTIPEYEKLHEDSMVRTDLVSMAYNGTGNNEKLYGASFDSESGASTLYTVNTKTFELTAVGDESEIGFMDLAGSASLGENVLMGVYGPYVLLIDTTTGQYTGVFDYSNATGGASLVGIAYMGPMLNTYYNQNIDVYAFIDTNGVLYQDAYILMNGSIYNFSDPAEMEPMLNTDFTTDTDHFQSLYFDGTDFYWSCFHRTDNYVEIVMIDGETGEAFSAGRFDDGVWPVGGLFELGVNPADFDTFNNVMIPDGEIEGGMMLEPEEIEAVDFAAAGAKGGLNAVRVDGSATPDSITEMSNIPEEAAYNVIISEEVDATNGLYVVEYDAEKLEFVRCKVNADFDSVKEEEGKVTIGFVNEEPIPAGEDIAEVVFRLKENVSTAVTVTTEERNDEHPENEVETVEFSFTPVTGVTVEPEELEMKVGDEEQLTVTIEPEGATNQVVTWESSNEDAVTVDENGKVKAVGAGEAVITVTTEDGEFTATVTITVVVPVTGVQIRRENEEEPSEGAGYEVGSEDKLVAVIEPEDATNKNVTWESSDENVVTVDEDGNIMVVGVGEAVITVTTEDGEFTANFTVTGMISLKSVTVEPGALEMEVEDEEQLTVTIEPEDAAVKDIVWSSSNERVATVDENGKVTAVGRGTATITVTVTDEYGNTIRVTVKVKVKGTGDDFTDPTNPVEDPDHPGPVGPTPIDPVGDEFPFDDVPQIPGDWAYEAIKDVYEQGLMNGKSATKFAPNDKLTRAEVVTILWRMEGKPAAVKDTAFTDVVKGSYYADAVAWANEVGVVKGISETEFAPNALITREQFAAILYRYAQLKGEGFVGTWAFLLDYADADKVAEYAYEPMCWCTMKGIINGVGNNMLDPQGNATRAQAAAMISRLVKILKK
ncbi:MAG: Ig-like domain-containing protein [Clostridia bacterium]|nr:Ig-like domain-containing protein [Clostridia bacterium]